MKEIDKLAWIYIKDNQLLCARSKNNDTYYIPGGKRDPDESDQEALVREIKEELSVALIPETITYATTVKAQAHGKPEGTFVKITCYFSEFTGNINANAEIEEIDWMSLAHKSKCSVITQMIMDWLSSEGKLT